MTSQAMPKIGHHGWAAPRIHALYVSAKTWLGSQLLQKKRASAKAPPENPAFARLADKYAKTSATKPAATETPADKG